MKGTPVINISGFGQGLLHALEAEAIGSAFLISQARISSWTRVFERVPQDKLQRSWILVRGDGKNVAAFSKKFFAHLKLDFPGSYEKRAEWRYRDEKQPLVLYAPKNMQP